MQNPRAKERMCSFLCTHEAHFQHTNSCNTLIGDVILSESPHRGPDYIVLTTLPTSTSVAIWKLGNLIWTIMEIGMSNIKTIVYCRDRFFLTDFTRVATLDVGPPVRVWFLQTSETYASFRIFHLLNWRGELLLLYCS
ncbi:hypothetical protein GW17_00039464 [Ensete ventricosum]|nr:hypothetical protein GW17_00039464 [Ensete ventricosum]